MACKLFIEVFIFVPFCFLYKKYNEAKCFDYCSIVKVYPTRGRNGAKWAHPNIRPHVENEQGKECLKEEQRHKMHTKYITTWPKTTKQCTNITKYITTWPKTISKQCTNINKHHKHQ